MKSSFCSNSILHLEIQAEPEMVHGLLYLQLVVHTGEEYDLLKEDTGWFDAEFKFDV